MSWQENRSCLGLTRQHLETERERNKMRNAGISGILPSVDIWARGPIRWILRDLSTSEWRSNIRNERMTDTQARPWSNHLSHAFCYLLFLLFVGVRRAFPWAFRSSGWPDQRADHSGENPLEKSFLNALINGRLNASWKICSLVVNRQSFLVIDGYRLNLF